MTKIITVKWCLSALFWSDFVECVAHYLQ